MMMLLTVMPSSSSSSPSFPPRFASESLSLSARESVCCHVASPHLTPRGVSVVSRPNYEERQKNDEIERLVVVTC